MRFVGSFSICRGIRALTLQCAALGSAFAQPLIAATLQNDSYVSGSAFGAVTVPADSSFGVKLTAAPALYPFRLDAVEVLVAGTGTDPFTLEIYQDNATTGSPNPGPLIYTSAPSTYLLAATNDFNVIDVASAGITIANGSFRVVLVAGSLSDPTIRFGRDNSIMLQRNTVRNPPTFGWQFYESTAGGLGDLIIRARVTPIPEPATGALLFAAGVTFMRTPRRSSHHRSPSPRDDATAGLAAGAGVISFNLPC